MIFFQTSCTSAVSPAPFPPPQLQESSNDTKQFQQEFPEHLVLMQVGDFYEIYGDAVEPAAKILDIAVTRAPNKSAITDASSSAVPMTGFPVRSFDSFLGKIN